MDDVLVIGEALVDIVSTPGRPTQEHPGGSPANVALGLARLGRRTALLTRLGNDPHGRGIVDYLEDSGVRIVEGSVTPTATSTATATVDGAGLASYVFDLDWSLPADVDVLSARALHTGSIAAFLEPGGDDVLAAVEHAAGRRVVSYDPNVRPQLMGDPASARARIERIVAAADIVKVSDEDLEWLAPGEDPLDVVRGWQAGGPSLVVLTRGPSGATGVAAAGVVDVPAPPITVVDTVGAGDAFMSGLLDAVAEAGLLLAERAAALRALSADELSGMLTHAVRSAAFTCTRPGAQPPDRAELDAWKP